MWLSPLNCHKVYAHAANIPAASGGPKETPLIIDDQDGGNAFSRGGIRTRDVQIGNYLMQLTNI